MPYEKEKQNKNTTSPAEPSKTSATSLTSSRRQETGGEEGKRTFSEEDLERIRRGSKLISSSVEKEGPEHSEEAQIQRILEQSPILTREEAKMRLTLTDLTLGERGDHEPSEGFKH